VSTGTGEWKLNFVWGIKDTEQLTIHILLTITNHKRNLTSSCMQGSRNTIYIYQPLTECTH